MATKVLTNARGYSYSTTPGSSSFHQDGDRYQDLEKVYTTGAYGPSTDWNKYASAYQGNNSSSKDSGSKTSSGSTTASIDTSALSGGISGGGGYDYASMIESMLAQQRAAAESAYRASMGRLNEAWGNTQSSLQKNLDSTLNRLKSQYDYSSGVVRDDADKSLREAYINYMMNKKNMNQGLTAMGLSGGATESNMAKMFNNYGSSRNNINTQLARNIADLLNEYQGNVSNANQLYNSQYADAMNNYVNNMNSLEAALANNIASSYSGSSLSNLASYASALANLNNSGAYTPTQNTLGVNSVTTTAGNNMGSVTDYAKWKAMVESMSKAGANTNDILTTLVSQGAPNEAIYRLFGAA